MIRQIKEGEKMVNLLYDEEICRVFLENKLPKLNVDEVIMLGLVVRGKYCSDIEKAGMIVDTEFIKGNDVDSIIGKIRKLGHVDNVYRSKKTGEYIPYKCFALYIDLQPCSVIKALPKMTNELVKTIYEIGEGGRSKESVKSILDWKLWRSVLSKSRRKVYVDIDIDEKDDDLLERIVYDVAYTDYVCAIETKNGYHVVCKKEVMKRIYTDEKWLLDDKKVEIFTKQVNVPVPGTLQGGFKVRWLEV